MCRLCLLFGKPIKNNKNILLDFFAVDVVVHVFW